MGFIVPGKQNEVYKLQKSLYGLKQAPRAWNTKFNRFLVQFGLSRCPSDHCVYYRCREEEITVVLIFVDGGLICSNRKNTPNAILEHLNTNFEVRSFPADRFLSLDIIRDLPLLKLLLTQGDFIIQILRKLNMELCHPKLLPAHPNSRLDASMSGKDAGEYSKMQSLPYCEQVGSLIAIFDQPRLT